MFHMFSSIIMKSNYIRRPSFYLILPCQDNVRAIMTNIIYIHPQKHTHSICKILCLLCLLCLQVVDTFFAVFFASEVTIRIAILRCKFWRVWMNFIDVLVSSFGCQISLVSFDESDLNKNVLNYANIGTPY